MVSSPEEAPGPDKRVQDIHVVEEALARAVSEALLKHKQAGNSVPEWRDGKVRWIAPEDIPELVPAGAGVTGDEPEG